MATNLYDYYQSKGQSLPSVQQRQDVAKQAGIQNYSGSAQQNTQLLGFLQGGGTQGTQVGNTQQNPINASGLGGNTGLNIPQTTPTTNPNSVVAGLPGFQAIDPTKSGALGQATTQLNQQGQGITAAQRRILELSGQLEGKGAREGELQTQFGLLEKQKAVQDQVNSIQESQKAFLAEQVATTGRAIGLERQGGKLDQLRRREAIDMLGKSAVLQSAQGNLQLATQQIDNALKLEFEPIQQKIETQKMFLKFNEDNFSRAEKQQAQALNVQLDREKRNADFFMDVKKMYLSEALKSGGNTQGILNAKSLGELSTFNQQQFESATTPSAKVEALNGTLTLLSDIEKSSGLNSRVGPVGLARRFLSIGDAFGAGDAFAGSVQQLTSQQTLNTLLNLKQAGGTLGALSDQERIMLQNAASKIGAWEKKDNKGMGKGIWDISEKEFKKELGRITELTRTAIQRAGGNPVLTSQDYLDIQGLLNNPATFNAANYY